MNAALCHRFFFALLPSLSAANEIERLSATLGFGRWVLKRHFHITLAITPDYAAPPKGLAEKMMRIPSDLLLRSFVLSLDRLSGSPTSLALSPESKPDEFLLLQQQLKRAFARSGLLRPEWRFNPHLTLLYRDGDRFSRSIPPIGWHANELVLVHSHVGLTRHDILQRWPLLPVDHSRLAA